MTPRRDCLDHVLIFGERHLRRVLTLYSIYYNETRTHLGLSKDAPRRRAVQRSGTIVTAQVLSGLHHRYVRKFFFGMDRGEAPGPRRPRACLGGCYPSSRSAFLPSRLTSPGLIPGPTNSFPDTSATASASSPSFTGTLLRTNSMARSLSDSYARKFRTIRGFPSESKVVTRMFHPAGPPAPVHGGPLLLAQSLSAPETPQFGAPKTRTRKPRGFRVVTRALIGAC